ncbi:MAG: HEAT repeat domain-containing protein [Planctomycetes bacterium]|nr:HEAT repeat domain-containing protein [Planctomycetota bacterium]
MEILFVILIAQFEGEIIQLENGHIINIKELETKRIKIKLKDISHTETKVITNTKNESTNPTPDEEPEDSKYSESLNSLLSDLRENPKDVLLWKEINNLSNNELIQLCKLIFNEDEAFANRLTDFLISKDIKEFNNILYDKLENGTDYEKAIALYGLSSLDEKEIIPTVRGLLKNSDTRIQKLCIEHLTKIKDNISIEDIFELWSNADLKETVSWSIKQFLSSSHRIKILSLMSDRLSDSSYTGQIMEFITSNKIRDLSKNLIKLSQSSDKPLKLQSIQTCAKLDIKDVIPIVNEIIKIESDEEILMSVIESSKYIKDQDNSRLIVEKLKHSNDEIRLLAGFVLRQKTGINRAADYDEWLQIIK